MILVSSSETQKYTTIQTQVTVELHQAMREYGVINWSGFIRNAIYQRLELLKKAEAEGDLIFKSISDDRIKEILSVENV